MQEFIAQYSLFCAIRKSRKKAGFRAQSGRGLCSKPKVAYCRFTKIQKYIGILFVFPYFVVCRYFHMEDTMPLIPIEPSTFERLQSHARPLVDTVDSVINRGLDALKNLGTQPAPIVNGQANKRIIDPRFLPSLTHTKVLDAVIDGESLSKTNWSAVRNDMLQRGMKHFGSFEKLRKVCPINIVQGKKEDEGYSYLSDIDISVQGQDSNGRAVASSRLRKA